MSGAYRGEGLGVTTDRLGKIAGKNLRVFLKLRRAYKHAAASKAATLPEKLYLAPFSGERWYHLLAILIVQWHFPTVH